MFAEQILICFSILFLKNSDFLICFSILFLKNSDFFPNNYDVFQTNVLVFSHLFFQTSLICFPICFYKILIFS
ncbi:unnamed protein product [Meloidogyne enterolobii]|uniref:Uncharacterized protein n=1 Tax=Meloidogyne enterolobii TaxID=390850 RepID=A0ACB0Z8M0_MELEN